MKIVHMADSHLGFSNYSRVDKNGRNLVEEMIYQGFGQAVDEIIRLRPDAVVHAGDVFHHVRPKIRPLFVFQQALGRLRDEGIPVIIISGNHDAPKGLASTSPFVIYEGMKDVSIARRYRHECFQVGDHNFHCIPFCFEAGDYLKEFDKIERSDSDVLVMHGLAEALKSKKLRTVGEHELKDSLLKSDFDYIALGHYHGQAQIAGNAWYSGSIEYFTFGEAADDKGMLLVDLESGKAKQIEVRPRYMVDYPAVDCSGLSSSEIASELMTIFEQEEIKDRIIRINLTKVSRAAYRSIDQSKLARLMAPALYFKIKVDYIDQALRKEEPINTRMLHEEFARFLDEEIGRGTVPKSIQEEVRSYGTGLIKRAVEAHNTEALNAPE
ncbi:MAG TPA: exonuclease SbcCD subunit D [Methanotrichaceae archaeon]|nr:exonuclease SbcCD subunit D [Methanotrichaceae archaeon]